MALSVGDFQMHAARDWSPSDHLERTGGREGSNDSGQAFQKSPSGHILPTMPHQDMPSSQDSSRSPKDIS